MTNRGGYWVYSASSTCTGQHPASLSSARWSPGRSSGPERTLATEFPRFHRGLTSVGQQGRDNSCLRPLRCHQPLLTLSPGPPCLLVNFSSSMVSQQLSRLLSAAPLWQNSVQLTTLRLFWKIMRKLRSLNSTLGADSRPFSIPTSKWICWSLFQ